MRDMSAPDKSIQSRIPWSATPPTKAPEKKRSVKKFLFGSKRFLPKVITAHKRRTVIITVVLVIGISAGGAYGYYEYLLSQNPAIIYAKKLQSMTDQVSQQFTLPKDEQPVVATVSNIEQLPKEAFFKNAKDGDKILMYKKHKEAVLFRPSTGQVITYAMLDFEDPTPTPAQEVAGASTSALPATTGTISGPTLTPVPYIPQGKILIQPQQ